MGGGGGGTKTKYTESPEQRALYKAGLPAVETVSGAITSGQPLWQVPSMPTTPDVSTVPGPVLPTQQYFQAFAPELKQALWQPYQDVMEQGYEQLSSFGQLGSQRGGASGVAQAYTGEFLSRAAPQLAAQAWQMGAPELQRYGQQRFQVGQMLPYQSAQREQAQELSAIQAPYQILPAMMGGMSPTLPTGVTSPTGPGFSTSGALGGGLAGTQLGFMAAPFAGPIGPLIGAGVGALGGGFLGGK